VSSKKGICIGGPPVGGLKPLTFILSPLGIGKGEGDCSVKALALRVED